MLFRRNIWAVPMRAICFRAVILLSVMSGSALAEPQYGICRTQVDADVEKRFQHKIATIEFTYVWSKGGRPGDSKSTALVYTDDCPGYHVYDIFATEFDCEARAYYGTPPNLIRYRDSAGGC